MSRWEPNAKDRLVRAAMELYAERGFGDTTAAEIAARAGLTERTFFRHFADKREVLFGGADEFAQSIVDDLTAAPRSAPPLAAVAHALEAMASRMEERREFARRRHAIIHAHVELRERELIKLAAVGAAMGAALRKRGVKEPAASLAAKAGIAVMEIAFERWAADAKSKKTFVQHVREAVRAWRALA